MAITYPLNIPGPGGAGPGIVFPGTSILVPSTPGPAKANLKKFDAVGEFISPFAGTGEQQQWADQHWALDLEWPEMTWAQFAQLDAFAGALHGKLGSFLWGPPLAASPQGIGLLAGMPVAAGVDAPGSNQLHTGAWLPNQSGILLPGDYLQINAPPIVDSGTIVAPFYAISRVSGMVSAVFGLDYPFEVWQTVVVAGTGTALDGGGGFILGVTVQANGSKIVTWNQPGADVSAGDGSVTETFVDYGPTPVARLYQYVNPAPLASDGGGNATLDIFPNLREAPPAGTPLVLINPQGTFRLAENLRQAPADKKKTFSFQMKCREAL